MYAVAFDRFGGPEVLRWTTAEPPHPGPGQIRIRVRAAGVSPADLGLRGGGTPMSARLPLPHIPGVDAAGVVDELGPGVPGEAPGAGAPGGAGVPGGASVAGAALGDAVFGSVDVARLGGAVAEFAVLQVWSRKPPAMPWEQAGAAASSIETATRALDLLAVGPGMTLLIDGAAGGVGSIAVQLAVARGARVVGTARPANHEFVRSLGATPINVGPTIRVDRALDVAGKGSLPNLIALTGDPAAVVTLADFTAAEHGVRLSRGRLAGEPDGAHGLPAAAALVEQGRLRVPIEAVFPFPEAAAAHTAAERGSRRGKIALRAIP
ncbi:NADP-dependent oxidoreductase [Actinoplanes sp. NPDC051851]|uniref:NADP-dependent oxidoreductase n=1 Tax=Actinoplanes sp. NPDC051851 TaxID=3154753 RepID=UPI00344A1A4B